MAQPLTRKDVEEIALLARLQLDDEEIARLQDDLTAILSHMDTLQDLDNRGIADVEPMTHAVPMHLRLRDDAVEPSLDPDDAVGAAPDRSESYFRVPHIIKSGTGS